MGADRAADRRERARRIVEHAAEKAERDAGFVRCVLEISHRRLFLGVSSRPLTYIYMKLSVLQKDKVAKEGRAVDGLGLFQKFGKMGGLAFPPVDVHVLELGKLRRESHASMATGSFWVSASVASQQPPPKLVGFFGPQVDKPRAGVAWRFPRACCDPRRGRHLIAVCFWRLFRVGG